MAILWDFGVGGIFLVVVIGSGFRVGKVSAMRMVEKINGWEKDDACVWYEGASLER